MAKNEEPLVLKKQTMKGIQVMIKCYSPGQRDEERKKLTQKGKLLNKDIDNCPIYTNNLGEQIRALSYFE